MKVLIVGGSGSIGGQVLAQCLAHPSILTVVAFGRRHLPKDVSAHPKLQSVVVEDFSKWPEGLLQAHADAVAMVWNMGTNTGDLNADLEYPLAFLESMAPVLEASPGRRTPFRYIHLSGKFVRQDQEQSLWFLEEARKMKGRLETRALAFAERHADVWKTIIVKPGGVATRNWGAPGLIAAVFGENWCIRIEWLGAFMTYLAVDGEEEESLIENQRIVRKGRELWDLSEQKARLQSQ